VLERELTLINQSMGKEISELQVENEGLKGIVYGTEIDRNAASVVDDVNA
jgi:hypothetical protein